MPAILRKSFTACEALAALPPTPRMNSRPPARPRLRQQPTSRFDRRSYRAGRAISRASARYCRDETHATYFRYCGKLPNPVERADFVKALVDFEGGQFAAGQQILIQRRPGRGLRPAPGCANTRRCETRPARNRCGASGACGSSYRTPGCGRRQIRRCSHPTGPALRKTVMRAGLSARRKASPRPA